MRSRKAGLEVVIVKAIFHGLDDLLAQKLISNQLEKIKHPKIDTVSISFNHDPKFKIPDADFKVLILWEPSAVMPWQYKSENFSKFDLSIPMSSWRAMNMGIEDYANHPFDFEDLEFNLSHEKRNRLVVMINSAKFSAGIGSLYGLRRTTSRRIHEAGIDYALYGSNWRMSRIMEIRKRLTGLKNSLRAKERIHWYELRSEFGYQYPEYEGWVEDKYELLSNFQLSLVIENEADWVTEKVFDSIYSGCVPIYVGPDLSSDFPKLSNCLISAPQDPDEIVKIIKSVSDEQISHCRSAIRDFVSDKSDSGIGFWRPTRQWQKVAEIISAKLSFLGNANA